MLRETNRNLAAGEKFPLKRKKYFCKRSADELDNRKTGQRVVSRSYLKRNNA